jgi:glyoxylase-like metal-dependent hydrolase (beta-lactamase superfamily II)
VRAVSLHRDVLVVTSAVLHVNCVIVRGAGGEEEASGVAGETERAAGSGPADETFVIDSPVLPDELDALPTLLGQAQFAAPSGLLTTHGDWDHLLGRLAFPDVALGCAESTSERLRASPGEAQRELRAFDEQLLIERPRPLALGAVQALPVPGRCEIGDSELELHRADGHTADGMAIWIPWARVLVAGDYLSTVEIPTLDAGDTIDAYLATLERLRELVAGAERVVPGHGPVLAGEGALAVLEEDRAYLLLLAELGERAELPVARRTASNRAAHARNVESTLARRARPAI